MNKLVMNCVKKKKPFFNKTKAVFATLQKPTLEKEAFLMTEWQGSWPDQK